MRVAPLELIRGLAALMVLAMHLTNVSGMPEFAGQWLMLTRWGTEAVVIFFLLSGTVIRLSMERNRDTRGRFLSKRALRILPLYLVAIAVSCLAAVLAGRPPPWETVVGNIVFLQSLPGYICGVLWTNPPLWSLSFEVAFYLLFAWTIGPGHSLRLGIWAAGAILCMALQFLAPLSGAAAFAVLIVAYSGIWLFGYFLVDLKQSIRVDAIAAWAWLGLLPLASRITISDEYFLAARHLIVAATVAPMFLHVLQRESRPSPAVRRFPGWAWVAAYLALLALVWQSQSLWISKVIYSALPVACAAGAALAARAGWRWTPALTRVSLVLGALSYALYVIHYPLICASNLLAAPLAVRVVLLLLAAAAASWLLEYRIQPLAVRLIRRAPANAMARGER